MTNQEKLAKEIAALDEELSSVYRDRLIVNWDLDRSLVSFQANKYATRHRWFKYKEGFSAALMHYVFERVGLKSGKVFDPFAGSGTTMFVAAELGLESVGIELLPSSAEAIRVRQVLETCNRSEMATKLRRFAESHCWEKRGDKTEYRHMRITKGAFPPETQTRLERYLYDALTQGDEQLGRVLRFAAMCVLESISYTRKDGQYLRWDQRSGRCFGKKAFDKGPIAEFSAAISSKLMEIAGDLSSGDNGHSLFDKYGDDTPHGRIEVLEGSCLEVLPRFESASFDGLVTSPPYCNRYDYTRTYALELALFGITDDSIKPLRQAMVSCTVENTAKAWLSDLANKKLFAASEAAFASQPLLRQILAYLDNCKLERTLNNQGIPRMVRNYFRELCLVIFECARVMKPGSPFVMVNDNVRYAGVHIPVDLILSDFAKAAGFDVETIWVLPRGKGNSSQQMGMHGREELRKCVYVWRKAKELKGKRAKSRDERAAMAL